MGRLCRPRTDRGDRGDVSASGGYMALVRYRIGLLRVLPGGIWPWFATVWGSCDGIWPRFATV